MDDLWSEDIVFQKYKSLYTSVGIRKNRKLGTSVTPDRLMQILPLRKKKYRSIDDPWEDSNVVKEEKSEDFFELQDSNLWLSAFYD